MDDTANPPTRSPFQDFLSVINGLRIVARCVAAPHELLVRKPGSAGADYAGSILSILGILVVPWLFVLLVPPAYGAEWLAVHNFGLLGLAAIHAVVRRVRRRHVHRDYVGDALLGGGERRWGELLLGLAVAVLFFFFCPTLGALHLAATVCSQAMLSELAARDRRLIERMKDARLEGEYYATRLRNEDGHSPNGGDR